MTLRLPLVLIAVLGLVSPSVSHAETSSENAEARVYFEEGNRLYEEASQASDAQRTGLLQRSLEAYVDSLRIVRSRNALFNAAIVLGELGRSEESFNYFSEYLRIEGLPDADRADAERRRDALRPEVAVLRVETEPAGARVWVGRRDLAPSGATPIELAVPVGDRGLFIELEGYEPVERRPTMTRGETLSIELALTPLPHEPVMVELEPVAAAEPAPRPRLRNAAIGTAAATVAAGAAALGVSLRARTLNDDYGGAAARYRETGEPADLQAAQDLADRTTRFNRTADALWGTTIALGISAIVLYGVHRRKQKRETPDVAVSISRSGGFASIRMPIGRAR